MRTCSSRTLSAGHFTLSNLTRLTDAAQDDNNPEWSVDGTMIFFKSKRDGNEEVYVMDAEWK